MKQNSLGLVYIQIMNWTNSRHESKPLQQNEQKKIKIFSYFIGSSLQKEIYLHGNKLSHAKISVPTYKYSFKSLTAIHQSTTGRWYLVGEKR